MTTLEIKDNLRLKMTTKKKDGLFGLFATGGPRPGRWKKSVPIENDLIVIVEV